MMNLKSFLPIFLKKKKSDGLTIRARDFNLIAQKTTLIKKMRLLTLNSNSGMNHELDSLLRRIKTRPVNAKVLLAYKDGKLVGWALLSKENSSFCFPNTYESYSTSDGVLFELYVDPVCRRQGIGTKLIEKAKKKSGKQAICIAPWDSVSRNFFENFKKYNSKEI